MWPEIPPSGSTFVPRPTPSAGTLQVEGRDRARGRSWVGNLSGCRWIPAVNQDFLGRHIQGAWVGGNGCLPEHARGDRDGGKFWAHLPHVAAPSAPCRARPGAQVAGIPRPDFCQWRDRCLRSLENVLQKQTNEFYAFLFPCPNRSPNRFLSCKTSSLAFPILKPPHASECHSTLPG